MSCSGRCRGVSILYPLEPFPGRKAPPPSCTPHPNPLTTLSPASPSSLVAVMRHLRPSTEIRQEFQYNNLHYTTLSHIIPTLTGVPYIEYVQEHIFDPLGMNATYDSIRAGKSGRRTEGFSRQGRNKALCAEEWAAQGKKRKHGHEHGDEREHRHEHEPQHQHQHEQTRPHKSKAVPKSCIGEVKSLGWWTPTDGIFEAGPGGVILSGNDMASDVNSVVRVPGASPRQRAGRDATWVCSSAPLTPLRPGGCASCSTRRSFLAGSCPASPSPGR
jgi:CubicO group peptidase (beta-lactamase class C family)